MILMAQSIVFLYFLASKPCIRVLTTSMGVFPYTEQAPATTPKAAVAGLLTVLLLSPPRYLERRPYRLHSIKSTSQG